MSLTPWKRIPSHGAYGHLGARKSTYKSGPHYKAATTNPAFCKVSAGGMTIPEQKDTFAELYKPNFKVGPILNSLTVTSGGDYGLILEVEFQIQCHTKGDYQRVEDAFCKMSRSVNIEFGYAKPWPSAGYQKGVSLKGAVISGYAFNATAEGHWVINIKAASPGIVLRDIDMTTKIHAFGRKYQGKNSKISVSALPELIAYHAQGNGDVSIDKMPNGYVGTIGTGGQVVVFDSKHLYKSMIGYMWNTWGSSNDVSESDNIVYVSLAYIVGLINDEILTRYATTLVGPAHMQIFSKQRVNFDPDLSFSYCDPLIRSAYPTNILIFGEQRGDYKSEGKSKLFESEAANAKPAIIGNVNGRKKIDFKNILINRSVVLGALKYTFDKKRRAETNSPKDTEEGNVRMEEFLQRIFTEIDQATGGQIKLRLSIHPNLHKGETKPGIYIFCEENGFVGGTIPCWVFDPVDGDGSTRSCQLQSNAGSAEYQGHIISGVMNSADPIHELDGNVPHGPRHDSRTEIKQQIKELCDNPGAIADNQFEMDQMNALGTQMGNLRKTMPNQKSMSMPLYSGMSMTLEIDGVFGILPGNAISSTQLPPKYHANKMFFWVESVTHTFDGSNSDWSTTINSTLSMDNNVTYI